MDPQNPQDPAQNPQGDPTNTPPAPSPAEPNQTPAAPDPGTDPGQNPDDGQQPDGGAPQTPQDGQQPSGQVPRPQRRIQQLSGKLREAYQPQPVSGQQPQSPQFPQYEDGQVVSTQQLQQDVVQTAGAIAQLQVQHQLAQHDAVNNFNRDSEALPTKFDELNADNPAYTPELDEAVAQEFQERAFVPVHDNQGNIVGRRLDPSVRLSAIAERHVKAARAYAAKANSATQGKVDASADTTAPRPGGTKPASTDFKDLSLDEMRAKVGYHKS